MFENKLFRFRTFSQYSLSELNSKTLWFSSVKTFNDPFEFQYTLDLTLPDGYNEIREWLLSTSQSEPENQFILKSDYETLQRVAKNGIDSLVNGHVTTLSDKIKTKICCLSQEYQDPLMWAHYTDGMTGFAIIYNAFNTIDDETFPALYVKYVDEPPIIDADCLNLGSVEDGFELNSRMIASKHSRWAYEKEIRFISCPEHKDEFLRRVKLRDGGIMDLPDYAIHGVIFGYKINKDNLKLLESICHHNNYKMYRADILKDKYEINVVEFAS
ncbi:DUF2971 domain-containing protein [Aliivibrio sp. SR45-2]|uniref:DUF2971 domain-containing protein n=1 Tax=Aliivibrio sp. SR45-2 TaxID=2760931 RepID=UPI0015FC983C|nr:DUF2971 domain-containing protein [Aliivibrio sp. SR45-2]MBB1315930.1 DUF2971 domain-containing protein [Aliivibrio sp. SR45-2]